MTSDTHAALAELRDGRLYRFADWPNPAVPNGRIGVYTVWRDDQLVYVGMAGRAIGPGTADSEAASGRLKGIRSRLASHASGRRSGDQFCVYVLDRLILPTLSREQIDGAARGQFSLDGLTRQLIRQSLSYRFALLNDAATARAVERQIQREGLTGQPPLLNPLRRAPERQPRKNSD
jgi:hypothetical protein